MAKLLDDVEAFLTATKMAPSTFGDSALGDRHFIRQLRNGRRVFEDTEEKVRLFMADYFSGECSSPGIDDTNSPSPESEAA